ncbi:metabotropic glutamate receptor 3, partial [Aplysia californica]|uniref:Metabotropic glutamate receptor 3 n=1 Tax=Aplysia californica TaxID=6500 RepID=A0ABM1AEX9_APLCA
MINIIFIPSLSLPLHHYYVLVLVLVLVLLLDIIIIIITTSVIRRRFDISMLTLTSTVIIVSVLGGVNKNDLDQMKALPQHQPSGKWRPSLRPKVTRVKNASFLTLTLPLTLLFFLVSTCNAATKLKHTSFTSSFTAGHGVVAGGGLGGDGSSPLLKIVTEGDVVFGGLFPMHEQGLHGGATCGRIKREKGIQRLEAMLYAVDLLNADSEILPELKIGLHVLDTCSDDTFALEQCMDFIKAQLSSIDVDDYECRDGYPPIFHPLRPVAGVIGAASSPVSIMVANILRLFKIPQISYASTSADL